MIWLTWRQFRVPALSVYAAIVVIGVALALSPPDKDFLFNATLVLVYVLPALVGVFWGVPLITREIENGTHNLVWNQTVTRQRWLATKLGFGVLASMLAAGLVSLVVGWWAAPIDTEAAQQVDSLLMTRMAPLMFAARGIVPIGYAAFAFVLGVAAGMLIRRTVAAMAVTLAVFVAVQVVVPLVVRPNIVPPVEETVTITASNIWQLRASESDVIDSLTVDKPAGSWVLTNETVDPAGVAGPLPASMQGCMPPPPGENDPQPSQRSITECFAQLSDLGYRQHLVYQPADRFWLLQWVETALLLALSALLAWYCFRRLRRLS